MSSEERAELSVLSKNPDKDIARYHAIIDKWYGKKYSDPGLDISDWLILALLILIATPIIILIALRAVRPLSMHITRLAHVARSVTSGHFGVKAAMPARLPEELRGLTNDLNTMSSQLETLDRELKASHVALAHELRSPLTASIGRLQGMIDGIFEPEPAQLELVMGQLTNLNRLIDDLHLLSLAEAGKLHLDLAPVQVNEIIHEKLAWFRPRFMASGVTARFTESELCFCPADPFRLGQVVIILIDNALRYAAEGKHIDITCQSVANEIHITFRDYGPGVSEDFLQQIFTRFSRADVSRSRHSGGSGLGLSIAKAICQAHAGQLTASRPPQGGLLFTVAFPISGPA